MHKEKVVYGIYINAPAEKIWDALTQSEYTRQYFGGSNVESDWKPGSKTRWFSDDGTTFAEGEVINSERGKILSQKEWMISPDGTKGSESIVTYEIEKHGDVCKLIVTHEHSSEKHKNAINGWEMSMGSLKSLLETGEALQIAA